MDIQISLVASANRVQWWERFYNSLKGNKINWEVIFVGDTPPLRPMPENFKWIEATVKPAQCYELGFRAAKGELLHWTADDADYIYENNFDNLDRAYNAYKRVEAQYNNDRKTVIAMRPIEDGSLKVWDFHHLFGGWHNTPVMAPFALVNREKFHELGGYDRRFVSGQSENDVVMRFYEIGGRCEIVMDAFLYVHHHEVHPRNPKDNRFREWYKTDRQFLEECWIVGGYGWYEKYGQWAADEEAQKNVRVAEKRQLPVERFEDTDDICFKTQGPTGRWVNT